MRVCTISALFSLLLPSPALAQTLIEKLSFGFQDKISSNSFGIPGWHIFGEGYDPQQLSDRVILTPPHPGNKRGAVWSETKNDLPDWTAEFEFRAGGAGRAGGNVQLWYTNNGQTSVGTSSIYTVPPFDGLALVIDTHSGRQSIRGFLNDGTTDYSKHANVDGLAFGNCDYNYRNLGRPSRVKIISGSGGLQVLVDENPCFSSNRIALPQNYHFGITAASSESPDSFEVFKFLLKTAPKVVFQHPEATREEPVRNRHQPIQVQPVLPPNPNENIPAQHSSTSNAQLEDLTFRLQSLSESITTILAEISKHTSNEEAHYQEILRQVPNSQAMNGFDRRLQSIESTVSGLKREIEAGDHKTQFNKLHDTIAQTHLGVTDNLPERLREAIANHTPRVGFMITSFILFQCILVVAYVVYKRRRANAPKKYL